VQTQAGDVGLRRFLKNIEESAAQGAARRACGGGNVATLMTHIENAKNGQRVVMIGHFDAKKGQQSRKCLPIAEHALIRHFVAENHDLVNVHGVKIKHHTILSAGVHKAKDFPAYIQIEAA